MARCQEFVAKIVQNLLRNSSRIRSRRCVVPHPWCLSSKKVMIYLRKHNKTRISNTRGNKLQNLKFWMFLVSSCSCLWPIRWNQVLSREWRCSWSSAGRRCSNYIWVINNFIATKVRGYILFWGYIVYSPLLLNCSCLASSTLIQVVTTKGVNSIIFLEVTFE